MKIVITEKQYKILKEEIEREVPGSKAMIPVASALFNSVKGVGTTEKTFFDNLDKIKNFNDLKMVNDIIKNLSKGKNLYQLINDKTLGFSEFTRNEKYNINNILNKNKLPHRIDNDGNVIPTDPKLTNQYKITTTSTPKGVEMKPTISTKKETLKDKIENDINFRKDVVAATLVGEAGGETNYKKAMQAVLNVLINRSKIKDTKIAKQAISDSQFSMWNGHNDTINSVQAVINQKKSHKNWNYAMSLVKMATPNPTRVPDITNGATHYYAFSGEQAIAPPSWADSLRSTIYPAIVNPKKPVNTVVPRKKTPCKGINCFLTIDNHIFGKTAF